MFKMTVPAALLCISLSAPAHAETIRDEAAHAECLKNQAAYSRDQEFDLFYKQQIRGPASMRDATRIYYGKNLDQYGDLRLPPGPGPFPVAIVMHGGNWLAVVNSDYTAPIAALLTQAGFATWNIEYSRIGSGGGWPGSFQSVGAATDHVRDLAKTYPLDISKVLTVGHSSGGHYALWALSRHNIKASSVVYTANPLKLKGALSLDGAPDIESFGKLPRGKDIIPQLLGSSDPAVIAERMADISPALLLPTGGKEYFLAQNSDRAASQLAYVAKANALGDKAMHDVICPANHFTLSDTENPEVREKIVRYAREIVE